MLKITNTEKAPAAIGPYSQAVSVGNVLFASGQVPLLPGILLNIILAPYVSKKFSSILQMCWKQNLPI